MPPLIRLQPRQALLRELQACRLWRGGEGASARQTCLLSDKNPTVPVSLERTMLMRIASFSRPGSPQARVVTISCNHVSEQSVSLSAEHDGWKAKEGCRLELD